MHKCEEGASLFNNVSGWQFNAEGIDLLLWELLEYANVLLVPEVVDGVIEVVKANGVVEEGIEKAI